MDAFCVLFLSPLDNVPIRFILIGERFFQFFLLFGNNWRYVSIYGGVLSLFMKFSRTKNIKFVNIPINGKKTGKYGSRKTEKLSEKNVKNLDKKLPDENDPQSCFCFFSVHLSPSFCTRGNIHYVRTTLPFFWTYFFLGKRYVRALALVREAHKAQGATDKRNGEDRRQTIIYLVYSTHIARIAKMIPPKNLIEDDRCAKTTTRNEPYS